MNPRTLPQRALYVLRHLFLAWFCIGVLSANLDGGPVDPYLESWSGKWVERIGLRQAWSMFAPNPVHGSRFVRAWSVVAGHREELPVNLEPPFQQPFFQLGYNRISKIQKKVTDDKSALQRPYADALCRVNEIRGSVELGLVYYWVPSPSRRLQGNQIIRYEQPVGSWKCHL
jgi:hypothetical protein